MQTWSYAAQERNDSLTSAVPAVLALLFKTISTLIEFRDLGLLLGKTILQQSQLKLIARALSGPRHKEHVISPCLRLLTELVSFDGGALARRVLAVMTFTFDGKTIARNLSLHHYASGHTDEIAQQPSVRSNTIRYVLSNLKFQSTSAKIEILNHSSVFRALFDHAKYDTPEQLQGIFETLKTHVLTDQAVPRSSKRYVFNDHNLSSIASIYRQDQVPSAAQSAKRSDIVAHDFLKFVCTDSSRGILHASTGYYPPGTDRAGKEQGDVDGVAALDLGLDSIVWYGRYSSGITVQNGVLSKFLQTLRLYASELESELAIAILRSTPELVADYFFNKSTFTFEPKLTATWFGYSTFLFAVVKLPLPPYFGHQLEYSKVPPPSTILIQSILPQPLSQKILTRCLNQSSDLITFFTVRILIVAFLKMQDCLIKYREAAKLQGALWDEGRQQLEDEFSTRCPSFKDVIGAYRKLGSDKSLQGEAVLRLIGLYYSVAPSLVTGERLDLSLALSDALDKSIDRGRLDGDGQSENASESLKVLQLEHLLDIASQSTDFRWWHKPESLRHSPIICLLRIVSTTARGKHSRNMKDLLQLITQSHDMFQESTTIPGVQALVVSLIPSENWTPTGPLFEWLDDALGRHTRKPIKYLDDLDIFVGNESNAGPLSPIWMTLLEQWPFVTVRNDSADHIAQWLSRFLEACKQVGEDPDLLSKIHLSLSNTAGPTGQYRNIFEQSPDAEIQVLMTSFSNSQASEQPSQVEHIAKSLECVKVDEEHFKPSDEPDNISILLHKPLELDISDAVSTGAVGSLILCLSSTSPDIRAQALNNLHTLIKRVSTTQSQSSYPPSKQLYLLLGIITNTASQRLKTASLATTAHHDDTNDEELPNAELPIPYMITVFGSMAAAIIANPQHLLYDKINRFLLRGPTWDPARLPTYWIHALLRSPPSDILPSSKPASSTPHTSGNHPASTSADHGSAARFDAALHPLTTLPSSDLFSHNHYHAGVDFLVSYVYHALCTPTEMDILRRRSTFEPLLGLASDPFLPAAIKDVVIAILWRASWIEGGSTTLITRSGVIGWLGELLSRRESRQGLLATTAVKNLVERMWDSCEQTRVLEWSGGSMQDAVTRLTH